MNIGKKSDKNQMAERKGLEPSASGVTGRRYNRLNYRSRMNCCDMVQNHQCFHPVHVPAHRVQAEIYVREGEVSTFFQQARKRSRCDVALRRRIVSALESSGTTHYDEAFCHFYSRRRTCAIVKSAHRASRVRLWHSELERSAAGSGAVRKKAMRLRPFTLPWMAA